MTARDSGANVFASLVRSVRPGVDGGELRVS